MAKTVSQADRARRYPAPRHPSDSLVYMSRLPSDHAWAMLRVVSTYTYRPAQATDRDGIETMLARSFAPQLAGAYTPELVAASAPAFTRVNPRLLDCATWFLGLAPSGAVVGCGGWTREHPGNGELVDGLGHLRHFCTDVDHLRRGIGRELAALTFSSASRETGGYIASPPGFITVRSAVLV